MSICHIKTSVLTSDIWLKLRLNPLCNLYQSWTWNGSTNAALAPSPNPFKRPLLRAWGSFNLPFQFPFLPNCSYSYSSNFTIPQQQDYKWPHCLQLKFNTHNHFSPPLNFEPLHKLPPPQKNHKNLNVSPVNFTYLHCHIHVDKECSAPKFSHMESHSRKLRERCLIDLKIGPWLVQ